MFKKEMKWSLLKFFVLVLFLVVGIFLFQGRPSIEDCQTMNVGYWKGEDFQNDHFFKFENFKFRDVSEKCIKYMGSTWEIVFEERPFSRVTFNDDNSVYRWHRHGSSEKFLKLFQSSIYPDAVNFTIPRHEDLELPEFVDVIGKEKIRMKLFGKEYTVEELNNLSLPEFEYTVDGNILKSCTKIESKYMETIRLDFYIRNGEKLVHKQEVCINSQTSKDDELGELCCEEFIPEGTERYGVIRWRGDEEKYLFKSRFKSIK